MLSGRARAAAPSIRIGLLTDLSGDYRDNNGPTSVLGCQQAIDEFGRGHGFDIELEVADHQNKPDVGAAIARQWFDTGGIDLLLDATLSSLALAVQSIARERNKVFIANAAATDALTGEACSPNFVHWTHDTWMLAKSTGGATVRDGGKSWFLIVADYAFGHQMQAALTEVIDAAGGEIRGTVSYLAGHIRFFLDAAAGGEQRGHGARAVQRRCGGDQRREAGV
jgi:branched-chain amino acid transport system substrate-binding protein